MVRIIIDYNLKLNVLPMKPCAPTSTSRNYSIFFYCFNLILQLAPSPELGDRNFICAPNNARICISQEERVALADQNQHTRYNVSTLFPYGTVSDLLHVAVRCIFLMPQTDSDTIPSQQGTYHAAIRLAADGTLHCTVDQHQRHRQCR